MQIHVEHLVATKATDQKMKLSNFLRVSFYALPAHDHHGHILAMCHCLLRCDHEIKFAVLISESYYIIMHVNNWDVAQDYLLIYLIGNYNHYALAAGDK